MRGHVRRFRVARGPCRRCGRRARGRHPDQTSDAIGAAGSQLGPRAVAIAAQLNKELGVAMGKASQILELLGGVRVTAGGLHQAIGRLARAAEPTREALALAVRQSAAVAADETGWRTDGRKAWLWAFVGDGVTVYLIAPGRGYEHAASVLGEDYQGVLERDGWAPYRRFKHASHQTCVAHLLRRASELIADSVAGQPRVPHPLRRLLLDALAVRDAHQELLASPAGDVVEGTCVEVTDDQPLLAAADTGRDGRDDRDDRDETVEARQDRQARLDVEVARFDGQLDALLGRTPTHPPTASCSSTSPTSASTCSRS